MDDEPVILRGFGEFLTDAGYQVTTASDGRVEMRMLIAQRFDLIITDILMPEMDGLEILMEIRKQHLNIPVIAISGGMKIMPTTFLPQAKRLGADLVFPKPVDPSLLLQAVQELLAGTADKPCDG